MFSVKKLALTLSVLLSVPLESIAAPILVDIGQNFVATGVIRSENGQAYVSGYETNQTTGLISAVLVTINEVTQTSERTVLGTLSGNNRSRADSIRGNYIVGSTGNGNSSNGIAWLISDPLNAIQIPGIQLEGAGSDTALSDVNSHGQFSGQSGNGALAISGFVGGAVNALQAPNPSTPVAEAVSELGTIVGSISNGVSISGGVWSSSGDLFTVTSESSQEIFFFDISSNDQFIGGSFGVFDLDAEITRAQAAVWSGEDWQNLTLLRTESGENLYGKVLGVTDNGYAVGTSSMGGFIWHSTWAFAQLFNDWALNEFGISIPTWVTSVNDVYFDGTNLNFALQGSAYFLTTPVEPTAVPEPASIVLLISSTGLFLRRFRNARA